MSHFGISNHRCRNAVITDALGDDLEGTQSAKHGFTFPYVIDETQEVARAYDAQCTPDFFGFNKQDELQYRGRLDASRTTLVPNARRDLFEAMKQVATNWPWPRESNAFNGMLDQVEGLRGDACRAFHMGKIAIECIGQS